VLKKKLERFQTYRNKGILIKDVNKRFKLEFSDYCDSEKYSRITIQRDFAEVKTICIDARSNGIETSLELDKLSFPREKASNIFLTFDEIKAIENIEKAKLTESLENAKDWLIISCFTAQRISDFMRFKKEMIRIENGKSLIEFTQKKTSKIMTLPLHPKVIEILAKRNGDFPYAISDQKYNDYIKVVCELAEITQIVYGSKKIEVENDNENEPKIYRKVTKDYRKCDLVSSHIGRRSFASNFYGTIPTTYLIYVTGHSTEVMFLNYIGKSNKDLALELTNYF
jgi:integrase